MAGNPRRANGHRRRELVARVKASETHCALCSGWVDKALPHLDPWAGEVDEDVPVSRGGSPYERANCHLMHRICNQRKGAMTLSEAKAKLGRAIKVPPVEASPIW